LIHFITNPPRFLGAAVLCLLLSQSQAAFAADAEGKYALEGSGRITCETLISYTAEDRSKVQILAGWTLGYLSAHNRLVAETYDLTPWQNVQTVLSLASQYCKANPTSNFETALLEVIKWAAKNRAKSESPLVTIGTGDQTVVLFQETVQQARDALSAKGFDTGTSNDTLAEALRAYQINEKMAPTGLLDQKTLANLLGR
jgi:hypothetical protein